MPARSTPEFLDIIHRALAGDNDAAKIILDEYREPLLCVIRRKINPKLRRILDSTDFLQDTFLEAFAGKLADKEFQSPQAFLGVAAIPSLALRAGKLPDFDALIDSIA